MKHILVAGAAALLVLTPAAAVAQTAAPAAAPATPELEVARRVMLRMFPDGTYKKMLGEDMTKMMDSMFGAMGDLPVSTIARIGGISEEQAGEIDEAKMSEVMEIYDPHWRQRMTITQTSMFGAMGDIFTKLEPRIREAAARAYAAQFSLAELQEIERFIATPTGNKFAATVWTVFMDPEVAKETVAMMPEIMEAMPAIMMKAEEATASLPPPRKIGDLSPVERKRLSDLMGVPEDQLSDPEAGEDPLGGEESEGEGAVP